MYDKKHGVFHLRQNDEHLTARSSPSRDSAANARAVEKTSANKRFRIYGLGVYGQFRVQDLSLKGNQGFRVLGFFDLIVKDLGLGFRVWDLSLQDLGLGSEFKGLGFGVYGLGSKLNGSGFGVTSLGSKLTG